MFVLPTAAAGWRREEESYCLECQCRCTIVYFRRHVDSFCTSKIIFKYSNCLHASYVWLLYIACLLLRNNDFTVGWIAEIFCNMNSSTNCCSILSHNEIHKYMMHKCTNYEKFKSLNYLYNGSNTNPLLPYMKNISSPNSITATCHPTKLTKIFI